MTVLTSPCSETSLRSTKAVAGPIAAVVLTYNSTDDLPQCLIGLAAQRGVDLRVIVVDNASRPDARAVMEAQFSEAFPGCAILSVGENPHPEFYHLFICNHQNSGYSAGNNIGARAAIAMGCTSVLIINPDVRIVDPFYVVTMAKLISVEALTAVTCSKLRNLTGAQENPMRELNFFEEALWPFLMVHKRLRERILACEFAENTPFKVTKVSGACFMIRSDFLKAIGYFDESVFLYCEESILMAQVKKLGWHMIMDPRTEAIHAHQSQSKGDPLPRYRKWLESRACFHQIYSNHSAIKNFILALSRTTSVFLFRIMIFYKNHNKIE